ncbi:MAG: Re/Si-specific NAD(P)(+) transhydrogenase subunit alpha [Candidatus Altiarchaeota archaeon]|nr:Re/Si-specific NAD(P)(+) transhydrogenase subunit alpha [Candidatus Altiarchaeota archaeon]
MKLRFGLIGESIEGERRVALVPSMVSDLVKLGAEVFVEKNAGMNSSFSDKEYENAGAKVVNDLYSHANVLLKVSPPSKKELAKIKNGTTLVGFFWVLGDKELVSQFIKKKLTVFSLELVPRITRAQSMDVLSSMSTVSGYKAVLLASERFGKFFPLLMTAAGTIPPANVLVIGAGVAGLQAIATAKRLGAKVEAFDTRPAVKEQVESLGARFVEMELPEDSETKGGYAKEASKEFIKKEREAISARLPKIDIMVTTAQVFGKKAPLIVTEEMIALMPNGSVIVDIAGEQGGNTELTKAGEVVVKHGVTILGPVNIPSQLPQHASMMYSRNVVNLLKLIYGGKEKKIDYTDEVISGCCVCKEGELVSGMVKKAFGGGDK